MSHHAAHRHAAYPPGCGPERPAAPPHPNAARQLAPGWCGLWAQPLRGHVAPPRRQFLAQAAALGAATLVNAQPRPVRLGLLHFTKEEPQRAYTQAFEAHLQGLGMEAERSYTLLQRYAQSDPAALPGLARELAAEGAELIVATAGGIPAALGHTTLPVVGLGELFRLNHPGGFEAARERLTGVDLMFAEMNLKRMTLLAEMLPPRSVVLVWGAPWARDTADTQALLAHARTLGLQPHTVFALGPQAVDQALLAARRAQAAGLLMLNHPLLHTLRGEVMRQAAVQRLPVMYQWPDAAQEGGLVGYGPSALDMWRQMGRLAWRVATGTPVAQLPVEQPARIILALNQKAARAMGFQFPAATLARADEVIE